MTTYDDLAQRYIDTWNETDPSALAPPWTSSTPRTPATWTRWPLRIDVAVSVPPAASTSCYDSSTRPTANLLLLIHNAPTDTEHKS